MRSYFQFCSRTPVIALALLAFLGIGYGFGILRGMMDGSPCSTCSKRPKNTRLVLAGMNDEMKRAHMMGTATLDTAYPLSILTFLAGVIYRFAPKAMAMRLCFVPVLATLVDFAENAMILLMLSGQENLIDLKALMTQIKFPLFGVAAGVAALCLLYGIGKQLFGRKAGSA